MLAGRNSIKTTEIVVMFGTIFTNENLKDIQEMIY